MWMLKGKRIFEWEQTAKICEATIWPHLTESDRRKNGPFQLLPKDLRNNPGGNGGMTKAELRAMKGAFQNVSFIKADDVRVRCED